MAKPAGIHPHLLTTLSQEGPGGPQGHLEADLVCSLSWLPALWARVPHQEAALCCPVPPTQAQAVDQHGGIAWELVRNTECQTHGISSCVLT